MEELVKVVNEVNELFDKIKQENEKNLTKGSKRAGRRARVLSVELSKKLKEFRKFSVSANK